MGVLARKLMDVPSASSGYSCTITIGDLGGVYFGYYIPIALGSIDTEPIPGEVLGACFWIETSGDSLAVGFDGDITGLVGSLDVWLGGVNYGGAGLWAYDSENDATTYQGETSPTLTSGTILLELK